MIGLPGGTSFHFALNDTIVKDNRTPSLGYAAAAVASFGGALIDGSPAPRDADGQNWDAATFPCRGRRTE